MKIYSALQIGAYHTNHCEDYLFVGHIGDDKLVCAVMDGCTMADDSYFASTLVGKLLRKITVEKAYNELYKLEPDHSNMDDLLKSILRALFRELLVTKSQLVLERNELLTTLVILVADINKGNGLVLVVGDGLVSINGQITEFDQDNKPDYLGYHLGENFDTWYDAQKQKLCFDKIQNISITTDGILMFTPVKKSSTNESIDAIDYLLQDNSAADNPDMLNYKLKILEHTYGLKPTDDLAVVRIVG